MSTADLLPQPTPTSIRSAVSVLPWAKELDTLVEEVEVAYERKDLELKKRQEDAEQEAQDEGETATQELKMPEQEIATKYLRFLDGRKELTLATTRFVLQSYLYILKATYDQWLALYAYTNTSGYAEINKNLEDFKRGKAALKYKTWFDVLTGPDLPEIPPELILYRCIYNVRETFDVLEQEFFDNYRTVSTSMRTGECVGGLNQNQVIDARIFMIIRSVRAKGLLMVFNTKYVEYEVVLPPGIRLTWDQEPDENHKELLAAQASFIGLDTEEHQGELVSTQETPIRGAMHIVLARVFTYFRVYTASFIPNPEPERFPSEHVVAQVAKLRQAITRAYIGKGLGRSLARARERIQAKAEKERAEKEEKEGGRLLLQQRVVEDVRRRNERRTLKAAGLEAARHLREDMKAAMTAERELGLEPSLQERKEVRKKYTRAEVAYQTAVCEGVTEMPGVGPLLGEFRLSARARKYCVALSSHPRYCILLRRTSSGNWRRLGDLDSMPLSSSHAIRKLAAQKSAACNQRNV